MESKWAAIEVLLVWARDRELLPKDIRGVEDPCKGGVSIEYLTQLIVSGEHPGLDDAAMEDLL
jgi:hypothetical protein